MSISFGWQNNAYNQTAATSAAVATGGNAITANDLLIAVISALNYTTDPGAITPPSGWTQLTTGTIAGNTYIAGCRTAVFYRVATGSEGTSFTFSWTNSDVYSWALLDYKGVNTSTPFDGGAETDFNSTYSGNIVAPAITTTVAGDWEVCLWCFGAGGTTTLPAGMVSRINQLGSSSGSPWLGVADLSLSSTGSQGAQTATYQYTVNTWEAISLGIQPASGGGGGGTTDDIAPRSGAAQAVILMRERASGFLEPVRELITPRRPRILVPDFSL